jgi:hypothetical protein
MAQGMAQIQRKLYHQGFQDTRSIVAMGRCRAASSTAIRAA